MPIWDRIHFGLTAKVIDLLIAEKPDRLAGKEKRGEFNSNLSDGNYLRQPCNVIDGCPAYIRDDSGDCLEECISLPALKYQVCIFDSQELEKIPINSIPSNVTHLYLSKNKLLRVQRRLTQRFFMKELDLSHNRISFIPAKIAQLENLVKLDLSYNEICYLPINIKQLKNLQHFNVSHNYIKTLGNRIFNTRKLYFCKHGIFEEFGYIL